MDIARPSNPSGRRNRRLALIGGALAVLLLVSYGLSRLKPAAPSVDRSTVWIDAVKRGPMVRQVRGLGTLVPEDIRWIPATTEGRVDRIILRPGTAVTAETVILELTNPQVEQSAQDALLQLKAAEADLSNLRVQLQNELLTLKAAGATVESDYAQAKMQAEMNEALARDQLVSELVLRQSRVKADELKTRTALEQTRLAQTSETMGARLAAQQARVDQVRALAALRQQERRALAVRAGMDGMLQQVPARPAPVQRPGGR